MATKRSKYRSRNRKTVRKRGGAALNDLQSRQNGMPPMMPPKLDFDAHPLPVMDQAFTTDPQTKKGIFSFWSPMFEENELLALKQMLSDLLRVHQQIASKDGLIKEREEYEKQLVGKNLMNRKAETNRMRGIEGNKNMARRATWERSACEIVKDIFPGYYNPEVVQLDIADSNYKFLCCTTMLLYGMISYRLLVSGQAFQLMFKGGRAIQMLSTHDYKSEDVDIQIVPTSHYRQENLYDPKNVYPYDKENIQNLSGHIALLIKYLLPLDTSILPPTSNNPNLYKISHVLTGRKTIFRAISDIDFKELDETRSFYKDPEYHFYSVYELKVDKNRADRYPHESNVLFTHQNIVQMKKEKAYLYHKYRHELEASDKDPNAERLMNKFGRALLAIDPAIHLDTLYSEYQQEK